MTNYVCVINYFKYSSVRSKYTIANQRAYNNYLNNVKRYKFKSDPKSFYKFVNLKCRAANFPSVMKLGNHKSSDNKVISNLFEKFFASTYSSSTFNANNQNNIPEEKNFDVSFIDQRTVSNYKQQLKSSHAVSPDGIPSSILKHHSELFSTALTYLFNKSLKFGYFPSFWKQ